MQQLAAWYSDDQNSASLWSILPFLKAQEIWKHVLKMWNIKFVPIQRFGLHKLIWSCQTFQQIQHLYPALQHTNITLFFSLILKYTNIIINFLWLHCKISYYIYLNLLRKKNIYFNIRKDDIVIFIFPRRKECNFRDISFECQNNINNNIASFKDQAFNHVAGQNSIVN